MTDRMFSPEQYGPTRRPLGQASTLPGWCYVSPEWYAREVETTFLKEWLCLGREDLGINPTVQRGMTPGAYRPGRYSSEEYIVHRLANYVLDRVVGADDSRSRSEREDAVERRASR